MKTDAPSPTSEASSSAWRQRELTAVNVLLLDCQTSGMAAAEVIEIGWQLLPAASQQREPCPAGEIRSAKVAIAEPSQLPKRITKLTGITAEDLVEAEPYEQVVATLRQEALAEPAVVVIHYAAFEQRFLQAILTAPAVLAVVCSHKLAAKLWPNLPSKSLRSVSGYLGMPVTKLKRSGDHIAATAAIWQAACQRLAAAGIRHWAPLLEAIAGTIPIEPRPELGQGPAQGLGQEQQPAAPKAKRPAKTYRLPRSVRLGLPTGPGVYHLLAADGQLLYVGKATNLKERVNSYFRGQKTKGSRLNELVSQVADLRYFRVASPLAAELLEQQHIAAHQPPYNVALVASGEKALSYIDGDLALHAPQDAPRPYWGPLTTTDTVQMLAALRTAGFDPADVPEPLLQRAQYHQTPLTAFFEGIGLFLGQPQSLPRLALSQWAAQRQHDEANAEANVEANAEAKAELSADHVEQPEEPWQADDVCAFLNSRLAGVVRRCHRGRWLRRLRYADLWWTDGPRSHYLALRGDVAAFGSPADVLALPPLPPEQGRPPLLTRHAYDRGAIVLGFIKERLNHKPHEGLWLRCYPGTLQGPAGLRRLLPGLKESS